MKSRLRLAVLIGALLLPSLVGAATNWKDVSYTTTQTGAVVWAPDSGKRVVVSFVEIMCGGLTAGNIQLWFGTAADTSFTQGTDQPLVYMDCGTPSATAVTGLVSPFPTPVTTPTADYVLKATTSSNLTVRAIVHGYER